MDNQLSDGPITSTVNPTPPVIATDEQGLTHKQRVGIYILISVIILVLGAFYWQLRRYVVLGMYGSFDPVALKQENLNAQKLQDNQARLDATYNTDTDEDALPDWEEMNIYNSSPFLADTDGDGFDDKQEVDNKTNPNCPEGKQCIGSMADDQRPVDNSSSVAVPNVGQDQLELLKKAFGDSPDTSFLRTQLLNATTNDEQKAVINGLTDQQLVEFYQQMIQVTPSQASPTGSSTIK